jgi:hypothetical protein
LSWFTYVSYTNLLPRFTYFELLALVDVMQLPDPLITRSGYNSPAFESFTLLCARLRSPEDQWSLTVKYGRPQSAISQITNQVARFIDERWGQLLQWDHKGILSPAKLCAYGKALETFGSPTRTVVGFLDCTIRQTCRPGVDESLAYTGYKKLHGMKFQGVVVPNGLLAHLEGPFRAPQNDAGVLNESELLANMARYAIQPGSRDGDPPGRRYFQLYGDSAYGVSPHLLSPFSGIGTQTAQERAWNTRMGGVRISVEHAFGLVLQDWPFLRCFWKHQVWGNACGLLYRVGVLLTNAHACLVPNQTAQRYDCMPPSLSEYFHS